jgi:hypothetical protein
MYLPSGNVLRDISKLALPCLLAVCHADAPVEAKDEEASELPRCCCGCCMINGAVACVTGASGVVVVGVGLFT